MKNVKRVVSLMMIIVLALVMITGCGSSESESTPLTESEEKSTEAVSEEVEGYKIGIVIWSTDDGLGADTKTALDATAEALGCELIYRTGDYDADAQMTAIENLVSAGVDAIQVCVIVDTSTDNLLKICEDVEIPMQLMFRNILDEEAYEYCMASDYFAGYVVENEEQAGADMVDKLVEEGCTTFGLLNREAGNGVIDRRQKGVEDRLIELGIEYYVSTSSNTATASDMTDATDQLVTAYSDIDALICSSGSNGAIDSIITYLNGTDIKLTSFDTPEDTATSFDNGNLVMLTTGAQIDPAYALINLYNTLAGKPLSDGPTEILSNYIYITSNEDAMSYDEYFNSFNTYTADEIKDLTTVFNSEMTLDAFVEEVSSYSLQKVVE